MIILRSGDTPRLYLETGRALVDEAGFLITTLQATKHLPDGRRKDQNDQQNDQDTHQLATPNIMLTFRKMIRISNS
ncbi:MAG: hypothetical protein ABW168_24905 [Sedimenticola sp.]